MAEYSLGRIPQFDERSRNFPIRALVADKMPRSYTWSLGEHLDQGSEGACVGFSWTHELMARPKPVEFLSNQFARQLYFDAQRIDQWEGGAYDGASPFYEGSSVLAGVKVAMAREFYGEYRWAFSLDDLILAIGYRGPAVLGIDWYDGMFDPDSGGVVHVTGNIAGGHAILANGVSVKKRLVRLSNSWGTGWGVNGDAYIGFDDLSGLLASGGEACIPTVRYL